MKISGSFLALVVAMVLLGGTPAALIGVVDDPRRLAALAGELDYLLNNVLTFAAFPLLGGIAFHAVDRGPA